MTATNLTVELAALQFGSNLDDTQCFFEIISTVTQWISPSQSNVELWGAFSVLELNLKFELCFGFGQPSSSPL